MIKVFRSVTIKFFALLLLVLTVISAVFIFLSTDFIKKSFIDRTVHFVVQLVGIGAKNLKSEDFFATDPAHAGVIFQKILDDIKTDEIIRIKVWDKNQTIVYADERSIVGMRFPGEEDLLEALEGRTIFEIGKEKTAENIAEQSYGELLQVYVPVIPSGESEPIGIIETYFVLDRVNQDILETQVATVKIGAIVTLLILFVFVVFFNIIVRRPLFILHRATREIGSGNLSARAHVKAADEFGALAETFNAMASELEGHQAELEEKVKEKTALLAAQLKKTAEQNALLEDTKKAMLNILEDLQAEKSALSEAKAKDDALLGSLGEGVVAIDGTGKITYLNSIAARLFHWNVEEVVNRFFYNIWVIQKEDGSVLPHNQRPLQVALDTGKRVQAHDCYYVRKDGTRFPVSTTAAPIIVGDKTLGATVVFRDIGEEKKIERAKTEFVSIASHQLRTPITAIKWYIESLLAGDAGKLNKKQKQYFSEIYRGSERMADLVGALLNVSRIEMGTLVKEKKEINLSEECAGALAELKEIVTEKRLKIVNDFDKNLPTITTDPRVVKIVFQNLLSNAVKYTPPGGKIIITAKKTDSRVLLSVADTGYGIPKEAQSKIFTKFFRADNVKLKDPDGTGLGLYIVKQIVEQLNGSVSFKSQEDKGSVFYVELPLAET